MSIEIKIPTVGESITEVSIGEWLVEKGAWLAQDAPIVLIETDKANMEIPAPVSGTLTETLKQPGDIAQVGDIIGLMKEQDKPALEAKTSSAESPSSPTALKASVTTTSTDQTPDKIMPGAARLMAQNNISLAEVKATGPGGRILKEDIQRVLDNAPLAPQTSSPDITKISSPEAAPITTIPPTPNATETQTPFRNEEVVPMTRLRKLAAERLVDAGQTMALLTTFNEVDMSHVMDLRKKHQDQFVKRYGIKLGFMSFFVKAAIEALKEFPALNAEVRENNIVYKNYYDIGIAVGGGKGLVVPIIRNAETLSFAQTEQTIADLATRARESKLLLDELQGGTFTISNGGIYGSMLSTPIINPPQSGILGLHNIKQRAMVVDGEIVARPMMYLALTYDHRIVDGRESVSCLKRIKECIEQPSRILLEV